MEKIDGINPQRINWCCEEQRISVEQLSSDTGIALAMLEKVVKGDNALSINQLRKIADYFNRGLLFFLEHGPVDERLLHNRNWENTMQIAIDLPNDFVTFQSTTEIEREMRLSYALWLFKDARVTLAKAAELAGLTIYDFIQACKNNRVPVIDMSKDELLDDIAGMR